MQVNELLDDLEYVALVLCHVLSPVNETSRLSMPT
jgi:hypothetical protein